MEKHRLLAKSDTRQVIQGRHEEDAWQTEQIINYGFLVTNQTIRYLCSIDQKMIQNHMNIQNI